MGDRVLVICGSAARWMRGAEDALGGAGFRVTRVADVDLVGLLLAAGGVRAVLVDVALVAAPLLARIARLQAADLRFPVLIIDEGAAAAPGSAALGPDTHHLRWPGEIERMLRLVGAPPR